MARNSFYEGDIGTEVAIDTSAAEAAASATAAASSATDSASSASAAIKVCATPVGQAVIATIFLLPVLAVVEESGEVPVTWIDSST